MELKDIEIQLEYVCNDILEKYHDISSVFRELHKLSDFKRFISNSENLYVVYKFIDDLYKEGRI